MRPDLADRVWLSLVDGPAVRVGESLDDEGWASLQQAGMDHAFGPCRDLAPSRALEPRDVAIVLAEPALTNNQGLILPEPGFPSSSPTDLSAPHGRYAPAHRAAPEHRADAPPDPR